MTREPGEIELIFRARNFGKARQGRSGGATPRPLEHYCREEA